MSTGPTWSPEEIATLRTMRAQGATVRAIAPRLPGRSCGTIKKRCHILGIAATHDPAWPMEDRTTLRAMREAGATLQAAADATGHSLASTQKMAHRMGIAGIESDGWSDAETARLIELWPNESTRTIARMMGQTRYAVADKAARLGLPPHVKPVVAPKVRAERAPRPASNKETPRAIKPRPAKITWAAMTGGPRPTVVAMPQPMRQPRAPRPLGNEPCRWPMWGNGRPTHVYCDAPAEAGWSWCPHHAAIGFSGRSAAAELRVAA